MTAEIYDGELIFEEPPVKDRLAAMMTKMVDHPHHWVRMAKYDNQAAASNAASRLRKNPPVPGQWKFETRKQEDDSCLLYGQFVGGVGEVVHPKAWAGPGTIEARRNRR